MGIKVSKAYIPGLYANMDDAIKVGNNKFAALQAENIRLAEKYNEEKELKEKVLRRIAALKGVITKLKNGK